MVMHAEFDMIQNQYNTYTYAASNIGRRLRQNSKTQRKQQMMKTKILSSLAAALAFTGISSTAFSGECSASPQTTSTAVSEQSIVALAGGASNFKTLVAAVKAAGLVETLQGKGPFTVFAPTDEAFAKLPAGTVESLLKPENREKLASILKYHVVSGKVMAAEVKTMSAPTVQGQDLQIKVTDEGVTVNNAKVVKTDLMAQNGVIHVIDTVLIPRS